MEEFGAIKFILKALLAAEFLFSLHNVYNMACIAYFVK